MTTEPAALVERMVTTVDYLRISLDDPSRTWLACAPLVNDPDALGRLVETTKSERGTDRADVATSLFRPGLCVPHRHHRDRLLVAAAGSDAGCVTRRRRDRRRPGSAQRRARDTCHTR